MAVDSKLPPHHPAQADAETCTRAARLPRDANTRWRETTSETRKCCHEIQACRHGFKNATTTLELAGNSSMSPDTRMPARQAPTATIKHAAERFEEIRYNTTTPMMIWHVNFGPIVDTDFPKIFQSQRHFAASGVQSPPS